MPIPSFPTLAASFQSFPQQPIDDTISSQSEAGYKQTRPRFTRVIMTYGPIKMIVGDADKDALVSFHNTVRGSTIFTITHPATSTVLNVRFKSDGRLKIEPILDTRKTNRRYSVEFSLEDA